MFPVFQWTGCEFRAPWYVSFPPFRVFFQEQPHISDGQSGQYNQHGDDNKAHFPLPQKKA